MKMKYIAIVAIALWLGAVGWLASMVITKPAALRVNSATEETATMAELRTSIDRNKRMLASISQFSAAPGSHFNAGPIVAVAPAQTTVQSEAEQVPPPVVSLVLSSSGNRTAFVNGEQVRAGQRLSTGGRVRAIGNDWVRIDDPVHGNQVYRVQAMIPSRTGESK